MLTREPYGVALSTPITSVAHHALAQGLEVPGYLSASGNSRTERFK